MKEGKGKGSMAGFVVDKSIKWINRELMLNGGWWVFHGKNMILRVNRRNRHTKKCG